MSDKAVVGPELKEPVGYVLAPHEVNSLTEAMWACRQVLGASEAFQNAIDGAAPVNLPELRVNRRKLNAQSKQIADVLERCSPQPIPENQRDAFVRRAKWLEDKFRDWLETREELHVKKRDNPAWQSAMDKARKRPELEQYITEWKYIKRRLEPGNPDADNLHNLRVAKH